MWQSETTSLILIHSSASWALDSEPEWAEGQKGYWLRGHESERNKIVLNSETQLVGQTKYQDKTSCIC